MRSACFSQNMTTNTTGAITKKGSKFLHTIFCDGVEFSSRLSKTTYKQAFIARPKWDRYVKFMKWVNPAFSGEAPAPAIVANFSNSGKFEDQKGYLELIEIVNF